MAFEAGSWVKWKERCPVRLGFKPAEIGRVVETRGGAARDEIDVEFGGGEVVYGAAKDWFEEAHSPEGRDVKEWEDDSEEAASASAA
jgi:hypothetical protein